MPFDYVIYLMLFIGFLYGLRNGIKYEIKELISYTVSFVITFLFVGPFLIELDIAKYLSLILLDKHLGIFIFTGISIKLIIFAISYILPFLLIREFLSAIIKGMFFRKNKHLMQKKSFISRIIGACLGLVVGVQMAIFVLVVFDTFTTLDLNGYLTQLLIKYMPGLQELLDYSFNILG